MSRVLYCLFNATNQLVEHGWKLHQEVEQTVRSAIEEPVWECRDRATDETIRTYDFTELFREFRSYPIVQFYKNVIPYSPTFICERSDNGPDLLILDLANNAKITVSNTSSLESCYRAFIRQIEQDRLQTLVLQFMQSQTRLLQKISADCYHMTYNSTRM